MSTNLILARTGFRNLTRLNQIGLNHHNIRFTATQCQQRQLRLKSTTAFTSQRAQPLSNAASASTSEYVERAPSENLAETTMATSNNAEPPVPRRFEPLEPDPYFEKIDLTFSDTRECFRNKSTYELLRSILVFQVRVY